MKARRIFVLVQVFFLAAALCACANREDSDEKGSTTAGTEKTDKDLGEPAVENPFAEHMEISWLGYTMKSDYYPENEYQKYVEEKYNVTIKIPDFLDWRNPEQISLMAATNNLPDFVAIVRGLNMKDINEQGLTRTIPISAVREYAPDLAEVMDRKGGWIVSQKQGAEELYAVCRYFEFGPYEETGLFLRLDWMENLGIEPKGELTDLYNGIYYTSSEPYTLDELKDILHRFVNDDPDKDGEHDTIGLERLYYNFASAFGIQMGWDHSRFEIGNILEDGKAVPWWGSKKQKDFLKFARNLYKEGLLIQDAVLEINSSGMDTEYWEADQCGAIMHYYYKIKPGKKDGFCESLINNVEGAKFLIAPMPVNPETGLCTSGPEFFTDYGSPWNQRDISVVNASVDDAKLERILRIYNDISCKKEDFARMWFGVEGKDYMWNGEPFASTVVYPESRKANEQGSGLLGGYFFIPEYYDIVNVYDKPMEKIYKSWGTTQGLLGGNLYPYKMDFLNETNIVDVRKRYISDLMTKTQKYYVEAILGNIDIDSTFDGHLNNLMKSGLKEWVEELNKGLVTSEFKKGKIVH